MNLAFQPDKGELTERVKQLLQQHQLKLSHNDNRGLRQSAAKKIADQVLHEVENNYNPSEKVKSHLENLYNNLVSEIAQALKHHDLQEVSRKLTTKAEKLYKLRTQYAFICELSKTYCVGVSCKKLGIYRNTVQRWKDNDPVFLAAYNAALEDAVDKLEYTIYQRALDGDTQAAIAILKAARPEKYRQDYSAVVSQQISIEQLIYQARSLERKEPQKLEPDELAREAGLERPDEASP